MPLTPARRWTLPFAALLLLAASTPAVAQDALRGDFETGDLSQWDSVQRVASDRIQVVPSPVRQGRYAARFEVRNGDEAVRGYDDRAELSAATFEREGEERWYAWSTMFDPGFPTLNAFQVVSQWHSNQNGSPPLGLYVEGDEVVVQVNRYASEGQRIDTTSIWRAPLRRGQWRDFKFHVKWSARDDVGFVELWVDGARQAFTDGSIRKATRTMYPGSSYNYFKQGYYRSSGVPQVGVVYHDGFQMSAG